MATNTDHKRTSADTYNGGDALDKHAERYLIEREVLACQSCLVDAILRFPPGTTDLPTVDEIQNAYEPRCPDCGEIAEAADDSDPEGQWGCTSCEWEGDPDFEPHDIMEWWLITSWLAEKLEERGEPILTDGQSNWWGRCCTGQSILLDGIMQRIVAETGYCGWPKGRLATT